MENILIKIVSIMFLISLTYLLTSSITNFICQHIPKINLQY
jgi:hypothetical protein